MRKSDLADQLAAPGTARHRALMRETKAQLEKRVESKRNFRHTQTVPTGTVCQRDRQADIYGGQYQVIAFDDVSGEYTAQWLAPSDELVAEIMRDVESGEYWVPAGGDRRAAGEREIARRRELAGSTFQVRFVSAQAWAAAF